MLSSNFSFLCRKSKCDRNGKAPVELSVIINGSRTYVRCPLKCSPKEFSVLKNRRGSNWLKEYLSSVYSDIQRVMSEMQTCGIRITAEGLKDAYVNGICRSYTLEMLRKEYLDIVKGRTSIETYRRYELAFVLFLSIADRSTEVSSVSNGDILRYKNVVDRRFDGATAYGYLSRLKSFFIYAVNNGKISVNPFSGIRLKRVEKDVEFLTEEEVKRIECLDCFGIERLERVRDLFVFQCHTALSYVDMSKLRFEDVVSCEFGYYVKKERQKTGIYFTTLLDSVAYGILIKYGGKLPVLSNQKYNAFLKEIGALCGIKKPIHSHIARHTCASLLINRGMPLDAVAKVLGHSTTKITKHYAKLLDSTVLSDMARVLST